MLFFISTSYSSSQSRNQEGTTTTSYKEEHTTAAKVHWKTSTTATKKSTNKQSTSRVYFRASSRKKCCVRRKEGIGCARLRLFYMDPHCATERKHYSTYFFSRSKNFLRRAIRGLSNFVRACARTHVPTIKKTWLRSDSFCHKNEGWNGHFEGETKIGAFSSPLLFLFLLFDDAKWRRMTACSLFLLRSRKRRILLLMKQVKKYLD